MKSLSPFAVTLGAALAFSSLPMVVCAQAAPQGIGVSDTLQDPNVFSPAPARPAQQRTSPYIAVPARPAQPGPFFGGQAFGPMYMSQTPEMAKKTMEIMALREMLRLRLTAQDIATALGPLHELREAEKTLQSRSERILEDEKRALLAAAPDEAPPLESGDRMRQALEVYRDRQEKTWSALTQSIGREKTNGLRRLLGLGGVPQAGFPGMPGNNPFGPGDGAPLIPGADPTIAPRGRGRAPRGGAPGHAAPKGAPLPLSPESPGGVVVPAAPPATPDGAPVALPTPLEEDPFDEPLTLPVSLPLAQDPTAPRALPPLQPGADPLAQTPMPGGQPGQFAPTTPVPQPRQGRRNPSTNIYGPVAQPMPGAGYYQAAGMPVPRLTLAELISLLEQKQGAMHK